MSASTAIADVTNTLEELLKQQQDPSGWFDISLKSPAEETIVPSMKPKINLFLFRVAENPNAKNQEWLVEGTNKLRYPPLALNLFYVMTPFAEDPLDEHRVLGEAMRIFYTHSILTGSFLKGDLENTSEELKIELSQLNVEELTRVWSAFTIPYRLTVCYEIRILLIDTDLDRDVERVIEKEDRYYQLGR